jgi:amino acid adenylation domain-containing protein
MKELTDNSAGEFSAVSNDQMNPDRAPATGAAVSTGASLKLSSRVGNLSPAKRALLEMKLRQKAQAARAEAVIPRRTAQHRAPLSFNQESLWFLDQLNPHSSLYNLHEAARLRGALNVEALGQALAALVARHEALRTTFINTDGTPTQLIAEPHPVELPLTDLSLIAEAEGEAAALKLLAEEAERPFDLATGPLLRCTLVRLNGEEHILLIVLHHIISDGWSMGVLWLELAQLYNSLCRGAQPELPALTAQFGDYTTWLREQVQGETLSRQLDYWRRQLSDAPALLELPADRPRPALQSHRGAQQQLLLPPQLTAELKSFSQREGVTLFMTLLAAFKALLVRYTGQDDLVIGSPVAGRTQAETENLIGFFVNTLALRTDLSGDPTFREALQRVRETALGAIAHQDVPFDRLVAELQPERSLSYNPIFQTAFALQPESGSGVKMDGLQVTPLRFGSVTSKFDLLLSLTETPDGFRVTAEYSTDLFDDSTITRLMKHFHNLLAGGVADPVRRISELPLCDAAELHQLLTEWNDTQTAYPREACIHELFAAQAARTPDAVAIEAGEQTLSYRTLDERSSQLANYLRAAGVGPDTLVGLFTDRSPLTVIGMLGILKAGGAYLPLDTSYPKSRLAFMLEDAQAPVILTQQHLRSALPETSAQVICLDADQDRLSRESTEPPGCNTGPENLAYVIYTSGSTGQPKGVAVPHRAVVRLVVETDYVQLDASDRIAQVSNMSFDAATFEIWGALLHGGRLVIITRDLALSPVEFAAQLKAARVTTLFLTTALFNLLAREVPSAFSSLRQVLFGGEAVDPQWVRAVLQNGPPQRLLHVYGPTESTTYASWHLVSAVPEDAVTIPIGRPIANTQIYLLDRHRNPVPVGVPGELCIGGDGLARGYLNRPALTAEKFIEWAVATDRGPRTMDRGQRLYRTGDLARFLPDGSIQFLGRTDHQIKLRGFRVELGEIEAALAAHPDIQESIVILRNEADGDKRLVAYFVAAQQPAPSVSELRQYLLRRLPDYMVPAAFVSLVALPLTPNGKVDRGRLPAPDEARPELETSAAEPKDELELRLKWLWEKVLGLRAVGVRDNFFELGGHSLIAVRLFTEIEKVFGRHLPLATLFQAPTIEQLAGLLREQGWQSSWSSLVPLRASGSRPPFFCVHAVGGNVLEYHDLARRLSDDQPFYGLQSVGLDRKQQPLLTIEAMAAHYLSEIRQLQPQGPYYLGGRSFGGTVAFEMARQLCEQGESVALLAMLDTYPLGWLKLFSRDEAGRRSRHFQRLSFKRHLANLRHLELRDKVEYVTSKARYKKRKYAHWLWRLQQKLHAADAASLAGTLRDIEEYNYLASKKYLPQVYPGRVTFFCATAEVSADENIAGWKTLASEVEVIPVPGDHQTMIREPEVQELAARLQECLDRAQRKDAASVAGQENTP